MSNPGERNPMNDLGYDPFKPKDEFFTLPDGSRPMDVFATMRNRQESMLPSLEPDAIHPADRLTVTFSDETQQEFVIKDVTAQSYAFGSHEITNPHIVATTVTENGNKEEVSLQGSSISPSGTMQTPLIVCGNYLIFGGIGIGTASKRTIDSFRLERLDQSGDYHDVMLNKQERMQPSVSYEAAVTQFEALRNVLHKQHFSFERRTENGFFGDFVKVCDDTLVTAARQGPGCGKTPMDEIYTYNAKHKRLYALRYVSEKGIVQFAQLEGVSKKQFVDESIVYDWDSTRSLADNKLHRLNRVAPFITYSWLNPKQETPLITVSLPDKAPGEISRLSGKKLPELMYPRIQIDLSPDEKVLEPKIKDTSYWIDDFAAWAGRIYGDMSAARVRDGIKLSVGKAIVELPELPSDAMRNMDDDFQQTIDGWARPVKRYKTSKNIAQTIMWRLRK